MTNDQIEAAKALAEAIRASIAAEEPDSGMAEDQIADLQEVEAHASEAAQTAFADYEGHDRDDILNAIEGGNRYPEEDADLLEALVARGQG